MKTSCVSRLEAGRKGGDLAEMRIVKIYQPYP